VDIYKVAKAVGGRVFRVEDTQSLNDCFATIDKLEKSELTSPSKKRAMKCSSTSSGRCNLLRAELAHRSLHGNEVNP